MVVDAAAEEARAAVDDLDKVGTGDAHVGQYLELGAKPGEVGPAERRAAREQPGDVIVAAAPSAEQFGGALRWVFVRTKGRAGGGRGEEREGERGGEGEDSGEITNGRCGETEQGSHESEGCEDRQRR